MNTYLINAPHEQRIKTIKILKGKVKAKCNKLSVAVYANRLKNAGIVPPNLVSLKLIGFKQGAFAEKLTADQVPKI